MQIALYQPDIAGNVGTLIRLAACTDVTLNIIEPCGFPFNEKKVRRSGMDYIKHINLVRHDSFEDFMQKAKSENPDARVILLTTKAEKSYVEFEFKPNDILLAGRECAGVPQEVADACDEGVIIPMKNDMRCLNVAISVAMVLGEGLRQTGDM